MKKRLLSMVLTLCMVLSLLPATTLVAGAVSAWNGTIPSANASAGFSGGDGSSATPYKISTAADLAQLAANVNAVTNFSTGKYFKMTDDIVLNDVSNLANWGTSAPTNVWTPIGTFENRFKGNFDGNNKTVSGIYIKTTDTSQGLFGCVDTCSISNLNVTSSYILGSAWVAGIAGWVINQTIITNCHNSATVIGAQDVGGVVGVTMKDTGGTVTVSGCSNSGNVSASEKDAGGIAGSNNGIVANSCNTGSISGYTAIGGVVGCNAQATTANCYNTGAVNSTNGAAGGIVGYNSYHAGTYIYNCYNTGNVTGTNPGAVCGASSSIIADCYWKLGSAASGFSTNSGTATDIYSFSGSGTNWTLSNGVAYNIGTSNVAIGGSLLTALNAWVTYTNSSTYNTWAADSGSTNSGYPIFGAACVPITAPDAPTIGTATAGNGQVSVSFTAPASNGGAAITGYTVTSNPDGFTGTGTSSPIAVTGLTNGTAYTFTVTATNGVCTSSASSASNSVTPANVPDAPTIGTATAGNGQASVSFTAPSSNGGSAITGYTVTSNPGGLTGTGTSSPIAVTGLTNGTAYTFTVTATNSVGTSSASAATNSVTPQAPAVAPTVLSVGVPSIKTYTAGENLDFVVNFSSAVTVGGTPYLTLTIGSTNVPAAYYGGSDTSTLTFRYTVVPGDSDTNGIAVGTLSLNEGTIKDSTTGNNATLTLNNVGSTASVLVDAPAPAATPDPTIDYANEKLTGLTANAAYAVNGTAVTADADGKIAIQNAWFGTSISLVKKGDAPTTIDSAEKSVPLAARPGVPSCTATQPSASSATGTVSGITTAMQYSTNGGTTWSDGTGAVVTGITPGTVQIRVKATLTAPVGQSQSITITLYSAPSSHGGGSSTPAPVAEKNNVKITTTSGVAVEIKDLHAKTTAGKTELTITSNIMDQYVESAIKEAKDRGRDATVTLSIGVTSDSNKVAVGIPVPSIKTLVKSEDKPTLTVETPIGSVTFDRNALETTASNAEGTTVILEVAKVKKDSLTHAQQKLVGEKPVIDLTTTSNGRQISQLNGSAIVTIPYTPAPGEDTSKLVVWYLADNGDLSPIACSYADGKVTFTTTHFSVYVVAQNKFSDVKLTDWFYKSIATVQERGLMNGVSTNSFEPMGTTSRAMVVTMLHRMANNPKAASTTLFSDVGAAAYYADAVCWATSKGIVSGIEEGVFAPDNSITREQLLTILYRFAGSPSVTNTDMSKFSDVKMISSYAETAFAWAIEKGIIKGNADGTLNPNGTATRAEVATIFTSYN